MLWFETGRIPPGKWPFLSTTFVGLQQLEDSLTDSIDLTEGNQQLTITGCLDAYRRAIMRRTLDLSQAVIASWNAGHPIGSVVCARSLLETLATFHSLQSRAQVAADQGDRVPAGGVRAWRPTRYPAGRAGTLRLPRWAA